MSISSKYITEQEEFDPFKLLTIQEPESVPSQSGSTPYSPETENARTKALRSMGIDPYRGNFTGQKQTQSPDTLSVRSDLNIGNSPVDFIDIMDITKMDKFDKIYQALQVSDTNSPATFRKKHEENFKSVTGSIIGQLLIQSAQSSLVDTILPDNIKLKSGVQIPSKNIKEYLKTAGTYGGGALAGSKVYNLIFGTSDYTKAASELNAASGQEAFGKYKTGDVTPEVRDFELKTLANMAAGPTDAIASPSVVEKIFKVSQPFKETGTKESEAPSQYYTPIDLKNRVPEGFDLADQYNKFFGGVPLIPANTTGGTNAPRPTN